MDIVKGKWKKNLFLMKTWETCKSASNIKKSNNTNCDSLSKSKSWHYSTRNKSPTSNYGDHHHNHDHDQTNMKKRKKNMKKKSQVAPGGCFSVYVGPEKQRFVVKAEFANHPMFKILLEDAELEYGYHSNGPILLPCDVDLFYKVLAEMDGCDDEIRSPSCSSMIPCSPIRRPSYVINEKRVVGYGGGYGILSPSRLLKLNYKLSPLN